MAHRLKCKVAGKHIYLEATAPPHRLKCPICLIKPWVIYLKKCTADISGASMPQRVHRQHLRGDRFDFYQCQQLDHHHQQGSLCCNVCNWTVGALSNTYCTSESPSSHVRLVNVVRNSAFIMNPVCQICHCCSYLAINQVGHRLLYKLQRGKMVYCLEQQHLVLQT